VPSGCLLLLPFPYPSNLCSLSITFAKLMKMLKTWGRGMRRSLRNSLNITDNNIITNCLVWAVGRLAIGSTQRPRTAEIAAPTPQRPRQKLQKSELPPRDAELGSPKRHRGKSKGFPTYSSLRRRRTPPATLSFAIGSTQRPCIALETIRWIEKEFRLGNIQNINLNPDYITRSKLFEIYPPTFMVC